MQSLPVVEAPSPPTPLPRSGGEGGTGLPSPPLRGSGVGGEGDALARRLPSWLKRPLPRGNENFFTHNLLRELRLETVCENARCPNQPECWARRTATFMILGNVCTRPCGFCSVPRGAPLELEDDEPDRVA